MVNRKTDAPWSRQKILFKISRRKNIKNILVTVAPEPVRGGRAQGESGES